MECTQRLECTQDFNAESFSQRSGPEQIGFLGICGQTYPVNLGPNKIGRDPQTCSIVLDMKSLSRQHAVINVLNKKEYMLMDLGSINKTKIGVQTLQAYIPYPLKNGDTVQFGDVFGMFRLFEDETDLPMTQQCEVPDTPVFSNYTSKVVAKTLIPESPDVSDKDDSFVAASQQPKEPEFKTPKSHFIKTSGKTILRPSIGSNKIDNIYWNSSQNSPQLKLDESDDSLNDTSSSENTMKTVVSNVNRSGDVHEMDTQVPSAHNDSTDSIYTASTQLPPQNNSPSIHSLSTQIPVENLPSVHKVEQSEMQFELSMSSRDNSIHNEQTQAFANNDINEAETQAFGNKFVKNFHELNTQFVPNISIHNEDKQKTKNPIHNAQTQIVTDLEDEVIPPTGDFIKSEATADEKTSESDEDILDVFDDIDEAEFTPKKSTLARGEDSLIKIENKVPNTPTKSSAVSTHIKNTDTPSSDNIQREKKNESDEEICFEEIDGQVYETFDSQPLLPNDISPNKSSDKENHELVPVLREEESQSPIIGVKRSKMRLDSDGSTDCEDIALLPTQNILPSKQPDNDETFCEDHKNTANKGDKALNENVEVNFSEMATQMLEEDVPKNSPIIQKVNVKSKNKRLVGVKCDKTATYKEDLPKKIPAKPKGNNETGTKKFEESFEEMATQILEEEDLPKDTSNKDDVDFEDMPTQIINEEDLDNSTKQRSSDVNKSNDVEFEEMATQIIEDDIAQSEQVFSEEIVSPFKVPFISPIKIKRKDLAKLATSKNIPKPPSFEKTCEKYYAATQEIVDDLCTQQEPENVAQEHQQCTINIKRKELAKLATPKKSLEHNSEKYYAATQEIVDDLCTQQEPEEVVQKVKPKANDEIVLCSDEEFEMPDRFRHIEEVSPKKSLLKRKTLIVADSQCEDDAEEKVNEYVAGLTENQIRDVVGLDVPVANLSKKSSSDLSDVEITPKKVHPFKFMNVQLPDSQEIKVGVTTGSRLDKTESSSESETDANSQENTPILFKKKVRVKKEAKVDLTKKFDALPTRVMGRVRKPPAKLLQTEPTQTNILKPKYLTVQEDSIDTEIITENITRLKNSNKKKDDGDNKKKDDKTVNKLITTKNDTKADQSIENKNTSKKEAGSCKGNEKNSKTDKSKNVKDDNNQTVGVTKSDQNTINKSTEKVIEEPKRRSNRRGGENDAKQSTDKPKDNKTEETTESQEGRRTRNKDTSEKSKSKERKSNEKTNEKATNTKPPLVTKGILKNNTIEEIINLDSDQENAKPTARPVRSTRGKKAVKQPAEPPSKSPEDEKLRPPSRRGKKSHSPPPETEQVRRSKRQKNTDSQNDSQTTKTKTKPSKTDCSQNDSQSKLTSFMKVSNNDDSQNDSQTRASSRRRQNLSDIKQDQSTVYNISGEPNIDTPKSLKRPAPEVKGPGAKRTRSTNVNVSVNVNTSVNVNASVNVSLRSTPARSNRVHKVLFTAFPNEKVKSILEKLGAVIVSDVTECDVLVTLQIKRTFKLLCVVGLGKPIVGPNWVQACADTKTIVDPWQYLMCDEAAERRFKFDLQSTLTGQRHFLKGHQLSSTPNVMPTANEMKLIVESSGGVWKEAIGQNWICVSSERDKALWPALKKRGATIVSTEFILAGVLRQVLDVEGNRLC